MHPPPPALQLPTRQALRYVTPLREGGSLPAVVDTEDGAFVMKFRGAGQGPAVLVAELIVGELARLAGLPVPEIALVGLAAGFGRSERDSEIRDLLAASAGLNLGLRFLAGAITYDPAADPPPPAELASDIVWLDAYTTNVDRSARNPNLLIWREQLWLIDHGAALYVHFNWPGYAERAHSPFPPISQHVLLPAAADLAGADQRMRAQIGPDAIARVLAAVPDDWLAAYGTFASPDAHRAAYADYLVTRLEGPRDFVAEAIRARSDLV